MTREETREAIAVMKHFADGGEVEYNFKPNLIQSIWKKITVESVYWDWVNNDYRIAKPKHLSIPITAEEKWKMVRVWAKHKVYTTLVYNSLKYFEDHLEAYLFLNPKTQCWEEWSEELERS